MSRPTILRYVALVSCDRLAGALQDVSGIYTSLFLYTDYLKMALGGRKVSGAYENGPQLGRVVRKPVIASPGIEVAIFHFVYFG